MDIKKIRQRLGKDEDLAAVTKRLTELHQELQAAQEAHKASEARLHTSFAANDDLKARALIEGRDIVGVEGLRETEMRDRQMVTLYRKAVELHNQTLNQLHCELSAAICREVKGEYLKLGDAITEAALKLREANRQVTLFCQQLEAAGVRTSYLPFITFLADETEDDAHSALSSYIKEAHAA